MTIMGIDPSMRSTGICVWNGTSNRYFLIVAHPTKKLLRYKHEALGILPYDPHPVTGLSSIGKEQAISHNIKSVTDICSTLMKQYRPDLIVIESCAFGAAGRVADLSGLNHCIRYVAACEGIPIYAVPPTTNKLEFTGNGQATKEMMCDSWMVCDRNIPHSDWSQALGKSIFDIADAYSLCHFPENKLR